MRTRTWTIGTLALVLALIGVACSSSQQGDIKLGYVGAASGGAAAFGVPALQGVQYAVDEINAAGGIGGRKVQLVSVDDKGDPNESVQAVRRLIESDKVAAIVTGSSSAAVIAHMDVTKQAKVVEISPLASDPKITSSGHQYMFVNIIDNNAFGQAMAFYGVKTMGLKNIAVMVRDDAYGQSIAKAFNDRAKELGANIVDQESYPIDAKDVKALLSKAMAAKPDSIMLTGYAADAGLIAKQTREMGITVPFLATNPVMSPQYRDVAGPAAEGTAISVAYVAGAAGDQEAKDFIAKFKAKTGNEPDVYQAHAYDSVKLLAQAIAAGGTDSDKIRAELLKVKNFKGASGATSFSETGAVVKPALIVQVKNNAITQLTTLTPPFK